MDAADVDDDESDRRRSSLYLSLFRRHVSEFRTHLGGGSGGQPFSSSYVPPTGYWTPQEKDTFFHALSIYSTLRPDLIAAQFEHKSVVDICAYIDLLAEASASDENATHSASRCDMDVAMEVSDDWVRLEETEGAKLNAHETYWEAVEKRAQNAARSDEERAAIFADISDPQDVEERQQLFDKWQLEQNTLQERDQALAVLDEQQLRLLNSVLSKADPTATGPHILRHDVPGKNDVLDPNAPEVDYIREPTTTIAPPSSRPATPPPQPPPRPDEPSDAVIDPVLLAESQEMLHNVSNDPSSPLQSEDVTAILANASPATRRRIQKRWHMRKRREAKKGKKAVLGLEKFNPGRPKKKEWRLKKKEEDKKREDMVDSELESDFGDVEVQPLVSTSSGDMPTPGVVVTLVSGRARTKRLKALLKDQSIGAEALRAMDLDLFNASALGKLMEMAYGDSADGDDKMNTSVSADMIHALRNFVVEFVTEALHRSIVSREQENALKEGIKVWRRHQGDKELITHYHIAHALELMGLAHLSKDRLFGKFFDRTNSDNEESEEEDEEPEEEMDDGRYERPSKRVHASENPASSSQRDSEMDEEGNRADEEGSEIGTDEEERKARGPAFEFRPIREMHQPLIRLPPHLDDSDEDCMTVEMDDDAMMAEIQEEEELDREDILRGEKYEMDLWEMYST